MENVGEFECWLAQMLSNAKAQLGMTDDTIAWVLLREGTAYYFRMLGKCARCQLAQRPPSAGP